ncbi:MAG: hypothetical protein ACKVTZ_07350 [Bacteroidia bacterium]
MPSTFSSPPMPATRSARQSTAGTGVDFVVGRDSRKNNHNKINNKNYDRICTY